MRVLAFGDNFGMPQLQRLLPAGILIGVVGAQIRPNYFNQLQAIAKECYVPFLIQPKRSSHVYKEFVMQVLNLEPDLIIVNSYSMLLHSDILSIPSSGAVNVHGGLLPLYRGCNPIQWALLNNEIETGVTIHYMDANFDTGDIIAQKVVPIYFDDTWRDIQARIGVATETMLSDELPKLLNGTSTRQPQDEGMACYYKRRHPEDGQFDWKWNALDIYNLIRALVKPNPGAFYETIDGRRNVHDEYLSLVQVVTLKYSPEYGKGMLKADRVIITPLTFDDLSKLYSCLNDRDLFVYGESYKPVHPDRKREWFNTMQQRNDVLIFSIKLLKTKSVIGLCQLHNINYIHRNAELQICIGDINELGHGYGKEAIRLLLDFAFKDLNLHRVYFHVFDTNEQATIAYEKIGFKKEGILKEAVYINGKYLNVIIMGMLRKDYESTHYETQDCSHSPA